MEIYPFLFEFEAITPVSFMNYPGITLRGGMGMSMKRALCVMGKDRDDCRSCILSNTCAYARVFESPNDKNKRAMKKATHYPHPFVMTPLFEGPVNYDKGDIFRLSFNLFGNSIKDLQYIIHSFIKFGETGIGKERGKFRISGILHGNDLVPVYSDSGDIDYTRLKPLTINTPPVLNKVEIEFKTPCRIQKKGRVLKNADFSEIIKNIVRRKENLSALYCETLAGCSKDLISKASEIRKVSENLKWQQLSRYSKRQGNRMPLEGFTGTAVFEGDLTPFHELLKFSEYINIGKNSSFGFGAVNVQFR